MISSELPEVLGYMRPYPCDARGQLAGELSREDATQEKIMQLATGYTKQNVLKQIIKNFFYRSWVPLTITLIVEFAIFNL
jgi:hypothetical protein